MATSSAATDDDLAYANFGLAAAYLSADFYARALERDTLGAGARRVLRRGRGAAVLHAKALSDLLVGAGDTPAAAEDFAFEWPTTAFATAARTRSTGIGVLRPTLAAYQQAATAASEGTYRILFASLAASVAEQVGAISVTGAGEGAEPFPTAMDLEAASAALEAYLG